MNRLTNEPDFDFLMENLSEYELFEVAIEVLREKRTLRAQKAVKKIFRQTTRRTIPQTCKPARRNMMDAEQTDAVAKSIFNNLYIVNQLLVEEAEKALFSPLLPEDDDSLQAEIDEYLKNISVAA